MLRIGFYKGTSFYDRIVAYFSKSPYTHTCFINGNEKIEARLKIGVKKKSIFDYPGSWELEICEIAKMPEETGMAIWKWAESLVGITEYDLLGVIGTRLPLIPLHSKRRYFCSELVEAGLRKYDYALCPHTSTDKVVPSEQREASSLHLIETIRR